MKKVIFICLIISFFCSCLSRPKNFTYTYTSQDTGLDTLIDIDGYYITAFECDSAFYSIFMFYPDGLFTIATGVEILPELVDCFANGGTSHMCNYPLWGTYRIEGDLVRTQVIRAEGNGCVIFRDYRISPDGSLENISDYVQPEYTNLGYMKNYPSFYSNPCAQKAIFRSYKTKRDKSECPFLNKKWFREKN